MLQGRHQHAHQVQVLEVFAVPGNHRYSILERICRDWQKGVSYRQSKIMRQ